MSVMSYIADVDTKDSNFLNVVLDITKNYKNVLHKTLKPYCSVFDVYNMISEYVCFLHEDDLQKIEQINNLYFKLQGNHFPNIRGPRKNILGFIKEEYIKSGWKFFDPIIEDAENIVSEILDKERTAINRRTGVSKQKLEASVIWSMIKHADGVSCEMHYLFQCSKEDRLSLIGRIQTLLENVFRSRGYYIEYENTTSVKVILMNSENVRKKKDIKTTETINVH